MASSLVLMMAASGSLATVTDSVSPPARVNVARAPTRSMAASALARTVAVPSGAASLSIVSPSVAAACRMCCPLCCRFKPPCSSNWMLVEPHRRPPPSSVSCRLMPVVPSPPRREIVSPAKVSRSTPVPSMIASGVLLAASRTSFDSASPAASVIMPPCSPAAIVAARLPDSFHAATEPPDSVAHAPATLVPVALQTARSPPCSLAPSRMRFAPVLDQRSSRPPPVSVPAASITRPSSSRISSRCVRMASMRVMSVAASSASTPAKPSVAVKANR